MIDSIKFDLILAGKIRLLLKFMEKEPYGYTSDTFSITGREKPPGPGNFRA